MLHLTFAYGNRLKSYGSIFYIVVVNIADFFRVS